MASRVFGWGAGTKLKQQRRVPFPLHLEIHWHPLVLFAEIQPVVAVAGCVLKSNRPL